MSTMEVLKSILPALPAEVLFAGSTASATATPAGSATTTISSIKGKTPPKPPEEFYKDLQQFHERRGTPIMHMPKISGCVVDLHRLYSEVTEHGGFLKVNLRDEWEEILVGIGMRQKCVNATAAMKHIYRRCLEKYERLNFFGEDPDKVEALEAGDFLELSGRSRARYPPMLHNSSGAVNSVPMSYNYRQHVVNMERRRMYRMSTDLHKASPYEKLMLSLMSPLPNEQDFAINVCTLMANESKHTLKLNDYPKLLDVLLAHTGVFPDYTIRKLFQHVYTDCRRHSLYSFWRDLLHDKPQILELYTDEQALRDSALIDELDDVEISKNTVQLKECFASLDFLNLGRSEGTQEYIGQRVQQVVSILRNLSFFEENLSVFAKNRTFLRFLVMSANIRWGNIHNQALDIAGNVATELELLDPTTDDLSRSLMATLCDGIEGIDRAVIINSLEILYKLCQNDSNEDHIHKCLNLKFYETVCLFLSLNDIMLLIFTLEAIYALTSMGARSCHLIMQVRGVVDQLVSLITVEAQSYGPDGCILMRVVETVPGNMLPMVAQNIANLQNVAVLQKQQNRTEQQKQHATASLPTQQSQQQLLHHPNNQLEQQQAPNVADNLQNQQQQQQQLQQNQQPQQPTQQQQPAQPQATPLPLQIPQSCTHDDEQYALAWLSATFEQAGSAESRVEQQELYRMYLVHCQKSGKHSVVNNLQFPRLVRLIFNNSVGPVIVRCTDGTELPGFHYVAIRVRAQPLPIQGKSAQLPQKTGDFAVARKAKKKTKPLQEQQQYFAEAKDGAPSSNVSLQAQDQQMEEGNAETVGHECAKSELIQTPALKAKAAVQDPGLMEDHSAIEILADVKISNAKEICKATTHSAVGVVTQQQQPVAVSETAPQQLALQQQPSSSVIKSLLANKVTQRQQKQKDLTAATTNIQGSPHSSALITSNVSMLPTQMQQQTQPQLPPQTQPIKVASTAISALVNNPLMQNTPVKVGQTTIKPLNPQLNFEKKAIADSAPPPLAPLSGGNVAKDASGRPVIIANQMLVEMLDKKTVDPPIPATIVKRKIEDNSSDPSKRLALDARKEEGQVTPSKNAANLYAEFAASLLEDEELDEMPSLPTQPSMLSDQKQPHAQQSILLPTKLQQSAMPAPSSTMQRQLLFQTNQPTAMATIKTDQGLQTVPVILQQKSLDSTQPQLIQQVLQQGGAALAQVPQQTQYVLATNPQGQTYLVAQQTQPPPPPPSSTQTVLVTQTPQQQSAGTKTIIILQQQQQQILGSGPGGQQKMIMTTPQGQQVLVTQRTQTAMPGQTHQQQFFINQQTGATTQIQHVPVSSAQPVATAANLLQRQLLPTTQHPQTQTTAQQQPQTGQISPSLLSQLNHIPATIKLHQPGQQLTSAVTQPAQPHQQATISRLGKSVSIVQTVPALPQIPQLQQHQSIIQQHIISGPSEKRQVVLSGRTIEIKETVITQAHPPPQQSQLNSQTIITKQPPQQLAPAMGVQQQTQQQQQQPANSSIIQKNITVPQPGPAPQQQPTFGQKIVVEQTNLVQSKAMPQAQAVVQTILPHVVATQASIITTTTSTPSSTNKKPTVQAKQQQLATTVQAVVNSITSAIGPPPLTASTAAVTTTAAAQQQQLQQHQENRTESKPSGPTLHSTAFTAPVSTTTAAAAATIVAPPQQLPAVDANWLYICDWRNCPRRKFKSISDLQHHACSAHSPDHLDPAAEIFCQWGPGPGLCDGIPRKRYSLMTHIIDRHITVDSLRSAVQRRIATGTTNVQPTQPPVTIVRNVDQSQRGNTASPALSTSSSSSLPSTGSSAIHAIKRHTADFVNPKELMDENEGPVTKSIRLTAALILRNLVTYTTTAKRSLRRYEPHLANVALSNVESSGAISHILYELNN